jgi:hypothetical protein
MEWKPKWADDAIGWSVLMLTAIAAFELLFATVLIMMWRLCR